MNGLNCKSKVVWLMTACVVIPIISSPELGELAVSCSLFKPDVISKLGLRIMLAEVRIENIKISFIIFK